MQKTGSTWLQTFILPALKTIDVCYKESFRYSMFNWSGKDLLISYENYVGYPHLRKARGFNGWMYTRDRAFKNLSFLFPDADIILVVRKQKDLVKSLYNQYIKVGGCLSFHEYVSGKSEYSLEKEALEYCPLIKQIKDYFSGRILLMDYELFKNNKEKFVRIFISFANSSDFLSFNNTGDIKINKSLSDAQIRFMMVLNKMVYTDYSPTGLKLPGSKTYKRLRKALLSLVDLVPGNRSFEIFMKNDLMAIDEHFFRDWEKLKTMVREDYLVIEPSQNISINGDTQVHAKQDNE